MNLKKKVHIISIQEEYLTIISKQVKEVMGDLIIVSPLTMKDLEMDLIKPGEIVILSNEMIKGIASHFIPASCPSIVAKRDINFANTKALMDMSPGQKILVINDTKTNAEETVQSLRATFFEHKYDIYDLVHPIPEDVDCIITPGESHLVPQYFKKVIDIGPRLLDIDTFIQLAEFIHCEVDHNSLFKRFMKSQVSLSQISYNLTTKRTIQVKTINENAEYSFSKMVAESKAMKQVIQLAKNFAHTQHVIHLQGEIGTGKRMLAHAIHREANQSGAPFMSLNCSVLPPLQLETELFGEENEDIITIGLIEQAQHGTIYLEEIEEMPHSVQKRLSQWIEKQNIAKENGSERNQFMLITSGLQPLEHLVDKGLLLRSFFYQLASFSIRLPSLKERQEDFEPLIEAIKKRLHRNHLTILPNALQVLKNYRWTGNVKELYNAITYLSCLNKNVIDLDALPPYMRMPAPDKNNQLLSEQEAEDIIAKIEEHGFLVESIKILEAFKKGKKERMSFGRMTLKKILDKQGIMLSEQQLRIRMEVLQTLGLLHVRQGRAGTTITQLGEVFLDHYMSVV